MVHAVRVHETGGPEVLTYEKVEVPPPGRGEVQIRQTAIGMAEHLAIMVLAVIIAVGIMFAASGPLSAFIAAHPTTKMLALAFLVLIGVTLVADGFGAHISKGYIYAAMAFSVTVEALNVAASGRRRRRREAQGGA